MDSLKVVYGEKIKMPERRRFDLDEPCKILFKINYFYFNIK